VLIPTVVASEFMVEVLPNKGQTLLEFLIVVVFGALFGWISIGFWTAIVGFVILLARKDRFAISSELAGAPEELDARARIAVIMPICEEPVERVFAGLQAMYHSLERTGQLASFDFYVLSDSADVGTWIREEEAWLDWCRAVGGFGRIFYRRRRVRIERKSGNVADFCRRFGRSYRYMLTLDADSLMTGDAIVRLVRMMEQRPEVGLIQTLPVPIHARTLYARIQQFANRVYGQIFATGTHFWQLGDAQYWGHNAIVRLAPFMKHCGLPRLPGKPPFGGEILSHDFVEAAMLGRAGFSVWLAYDLPGSFEELPSSLLEDLHRDRRWCQGNFQHLRLVLVNGLFGVHRVLFLNGALAYVSASLWLFFLSLSTVDAVLQVVRVPDYFPTGKVLFPAWPTWHPQWALSLFTVTMLILFLPKVLGACLVFVRGPGVGAFGGPLRFVLSLLLETVASSLYAPIRMLFHSKFVVTNVLGRVVAWRSPPRGDHETSWAEALRHHSGATLLACIWGGGVYWTNPQYFWWLTPILGALVLSIPVSVLMSRMHLGDAARRARLFATPEEISPPAEIRDHAAALREARARHEALAPAERDGFVRAIVDPYINALHRWLLRDPRPMRPSIREARHRLCARALADGPAALDPRARRIVLSDPACVDELHAGVWQIESPERAAAWGRPGVEDPVRDGAE
jgi:membrane glycosyltransferase